jgi:uncharacterized 2Fe-2S/4Fe-4S cluster protein (DUF4445 family)
VYSINVQPDNRIIEAKPEDNLLKLLTGSGIRISSGCGGKGTCGKCKIIVKSGRYPTAKSHLLTEGEANKNYVLACQTEITDNLTVEIPVESRSTVEEIFTPAEAIEKAPTRPEEGIFVHSPLARKIYLVLEPPSLKNNIPDWDRIKHEIDIPVEINLELLRVLDGILRQFGWKFTAVITEYDGKNRLIQIEPGDTAKKNYGIALDIGTTTVVTYLVELNSGTILNARASYNRQISFGDDIITRIIYAGEKNGLKKLNTAVLDTVNSLIDSVTDEEGISPKDIYALQCAGNTTMMHLFFNVSPENIRREPYVPVFNLPPYVRASELGIHTNPKGVISCISGAASYVGGDITAGVLACGMDNFSTVSLLVDLGTNGEIVLGNKDWLLCCACSAGPAFEGVGIKCGIHAMEGAIQKVEISSDNVKYSTIGNAAPRGICGSGLLDIPAEFLKKGIIDRAGKFTEDAVSSIRSKGAVFLGIQVLLKKVGLNFDNINHIYVSGGFGTCIDIEKAIIVGLMPDLPHEKFSFIGNSSVTGAKMCLLSKEARDKY